MPKQFYTEKDIEDMFKGGVMSLEVHDHIVLTELAFEKARAIGMKLVRMNSDHPPSAPVRPYLSQKQGSHPGAPVAAASAPPPPGCACGEPAAVKLPKINLQQRIRDAVIARAGSEVDVNLLDVIIKRVLASTGVK
jgi:hypothetical protein